MMNSLAFDAETHRYTLDGERVVGVTEALRPLIDFSHVPSAVLQLAQARGRIVHHALYLKNVGDLDEDAFARDFPEYSGYLQAWQTFCDQRSFLPLLNEYRVASRRHRVAGTLDSLGVLDGRAVLLDYATGRPQDVAKHLQTAAYYGLALETAQEDRPLAQFFEKYPVVKRAAVALRKDGTFTVETYTDPTDYREFLALVAAHWVVVKHRPRAVRELAEVA